MKIVFTCGRFNPPTVGHSAVVEAMRKVADGNGAQVRLYTTRSHDPQRNPLSPEVKLGFLRDAFPGATIDLTSHPFAAAETIAAEGADEVILVLGEDRADMAENFIRHAEKIGLRASVHLVSRSETDASATAARQAAASGDFEEFERLIGGEYAGRLYRAVRLGMEMDEHDL